MRMHFPPGLAYWLIRVGIFVLFVPCASIMAFRGMIWWEALLFLAAGWVVTGWALRRPRCGACDAQLYATTYRNFLGQRSGRIFVQRCFVCCADLWTWKRPEPLPKEQVDQLRKDYDARLEHDFP